jgi:plastocyanin
VEDFKMHCYNGHRISWHFSIAALSTISVLALLLGLSSCNGSSIVLPDEHTIIVSMTPADSFTPQEITVNPGDVVKFVNTDTDPHAPNVDPGNLRSGGPVSDATLPSGVAPGDTYEWTVPSDAQEGTMWFYHCRFHGTAGDGHRLGQDMVGLITVINPPEFQVDATASDTFDPETINVEPGTVIVWRNIDTDPHAPIVDPLNVAAGGPDSDAVFPSGVEPGTSYSWRVPIDAVLGTDWFYHCRFHGVAGDGTSLGTGMVGLIVSN